MRGKDEKRQNALVALSDMARERYTDGSGVLVYLAKVPTTWDGGLLESTSDEVEVIESASWKLDQISWSSGTMVLMVFHRKD